MSDVVGPTPEPVADAVANEQKQQLRRAIDQLPDRQREVAVVCLGEGASAGEAARVLGITEANVHATLHVVRKRLTTVLQRTSERPA